jgi:branched-chain amino acid transport system substrate-binding protein
MIADAIKRAGSTDPDKLVDALEKTDYVGTVGRIQFYGKDDPFTHAMKYGKDYVSGIALQWQDGKQVCVWPSSICSGKVAFPSFVKVSASTN